MSYNAVNSTCLMAAQPWVKAQKHDDFMLMIFCHEEHVNGVLWVREQHGIVSNRMLTSPKLIRVLMGRNRIVSQANTHEENQGSPLCKSNGTLFSDIGINELTSVLHNYKTPVTKYCILTCC